MNINNIFVEFDKMMAQERKKRCTCLCHKPKSEIWKKCSCCTIGHKR